MVDEGHIVANHTNHHYSMPSVTYSTDVFNKELTDVEDKFKELTGKDMPKFLDLLWDSILKKFSYD